MCCVFGRLVVISYLYLQLSGFTAIELKPMIMYFYYLIFLINYVVYKLAEKIMKTASKQSLKVIVLFDKVKNSIYSIHNKIQRKVIKSSQL